MSHDHHHGAAASAGKLKFAVALTLAFVIGEAIAGRMAHSLALLSDAGHNFADALALGFSLYAIWIAQKPSSSGMTFGYHRVSILAALVNALSLVVIAIFILIEAAERLRHPGEVNSGLMIAVAAAAIVVNVVISIWLHAGQHDLNMRSAYVHMVGDAISALGVVIAGVIVAVTKTKLADPIISFLIAALILYSSWGVLRESINVLLEGTPAGMNMASVIATIRDVAAVQDVHDLHVWMVGSGVIACSCHVVVAEQSIRQGQHVLREICAKLCDQHRINHATIQIEVEGCEQAEMFCNPSPNEEAAHAGHHH